ncbi:hypothetical protein BWZ22_04025 [Seonamhaeicola sp. S2-3]|uniref:DUF6520 family protein n=1 Tax=Seonamhaeicola sp. S2-3 TaxID=1936081 RepID=UPI00097294C4|nr:DUF6520 family protein [Seonamhaeicola sp. S2-3]APY10457.1 hypothetical protein BWZ22_04025 [Seonamhaeicola sp. S2-3]
MKTKVLKGLLPALVMVLAIGLSFATVSSEVNQQGYYWDPITNQIEEVPGGVDCPPSGTEACLYEEQPVFADEDRTIPLYEKD